ncbi:unnamed protein product [Paramecium sonneborni]|uniref:Uncharacterized protein n=1 Tax=Paramecium sonneborni TaxID=65129 RepID=A0A8S1RBS5_9CILI|nr:unnamed protein product [Paramecium sonneborni]
MLILNQKENFANSSNIFFKGCNKNNVRFGKWDYIVKGESMFGGNYNERGQKDGKWIEPDLDNEENYITFQGEYRADIKIGIWNTFIRRDLIGGGFYNEKGRKHGMWIEHQKKTAFNFLLLYKGKYEEGKKVNQWEWSLDSEVIGQGKYKNNGEKNQFWIELNENYSRLCNLKSQGSYKNGMRIGDWKIVDDDKVIGGGRYSGEFKKIGIWKEPFGNYNILEPALFEGNYQNDIRVDQWKIILNEMIIGGGNYDKNGQKQGDWMDVRMINIYKYLTMRGQYYQGLRILKWNYKMNDLSFQGMYNDNGEKMDYWIDFDEKYNENDIILTGKYKYGIRIGVWKLQQNNKIIGHGLYNEEGKKFGLWKELHPNYSEMCQLIMKGEYKNGIKIGYWQILTQNQNKLIGGGSFNIQGEQFGKWIELHKQYSKYRQVVSIGYYENGIRIGGWEDIYMNKIINYHYYDRDGIRRRIEIKQ